MNHLLSISLAAAAITLTACSTKQGKANTEAEDQGRAAAQAVLAIDTVQPVDSFALERAILNAKAVQSKYLADGNTESAEHFDQAFRETINQRCPDLGKQMFLHTADPDAE